MFFYAAKTLWFLAQPSSVTPWPVDYRTSGRVEFWPKAGIPEGLRQMDFVMREYAGLVT